ncbi:MAG: hypothetical protein ABII71_02925 [Candidatus Micrarchaeota archaeon]
MSFEQRRVRFSAALQGTKKKRPGLTGFLLDDLSALGINRLKIGDVAEKMREHGHSAEFYALTVRAALERHKVEATPKEVIDAREDVYGAPTSALWDILGRTRTKPLLCSINEVLASNSALAEELKYMNSRAEIEFEIRHAQRRLNFCSLSGAAVAMVTQLAAAAHSGTTAGSVLTGASFLLISFFVIGTLSRLSTLNEVRDRLRKLEESSNQKSGQQ